MGVPGLFSWVRRQFPEAIIPEEVWSKSSPAPVSSLFVDLNHILHACTHPEYPYEEPSSRDAMLEAILLYIEALLALVQPTDLLFIAVDGPPPRAKMNQQRSRRFLAAMEAADRKRMQEQARTALASLLVPPAEPKARTATAVRAELSRGVWGAGGGGSVIAAVAAAAAAAAGAAAADKAAAASVWSCPACTLVNPAARASCDACGGARPAPAGQ